MIRPHTTRAAGFARRHVAVVVLARVRGRTLFTRVGILPVAISLTCGRPCVPSGRHGSMACAASTASHLHAFAAGSWAGPRPDKTATWPAHGSDARRRPRAQPIPAGHDQCLTGKTFVLTGTFEALGRTEAVDLIKRHSGRVTGSVSGKTTFLVAGDGCSKSKLETVRNSARPLGGMPGSGGDQAAASWLPASA